MATTSQLKAFMDQEAQANSPSHWSTIEAAVELLLNQLGSGGGGENVTIVGTTPTGNTTSATSNISTGGPTVINAGALSIEFILFPSAIGTINGATFDNTSANVLGVYRLDAPPWKPLSALTYTLTAGAGILTVQT